MAFYIPFTCVTLFQFHFITFPVLFTKKNFVIREMKIFLYIWLLQCPRKFYIRTSYLNLLGVSRLSKEVEKVLTKVRNEVKPSKTIRNHLK